MRILFPNSPLTIYYNIKKPPNNQLVKRFLSTRGGNRTRVSDIQSLLYTDYQYKDKNKFHFFGGTFGGAFFKFNRQLNIIKYICDKNQILSIMATIKCTECGYDELSSKAEICPKCNYPIAKERVKKRMNYLIAVLIIVLAALYMLKQAEII